MAFNKPGPGRPKGSLNKTTPEVKVAARALVNDPEYRAALRTRLQAGSAPHMETLLWHYAYGKPIERVEHTGSGGEPLVIERVIIDSLPQDAEDEQVTTH